MTGKKFDAMTDCEVKEYGNFTAIDNLKVNGKLTLGENTADNGGLRLAYFAFLADAQRKDIDLEAKQDGYTPLQQFFIAYGQNWCGDHAAGGAEAASPDRSAFARRIPRQRRGRRISRFWQGVRMQSGPGP